MNQWEEFAHMQIDPCWPGNLKRFSTTIMPLFQTINKHSCILCHHDGPGLGFLGGFIAVSRRALGSFSAVSRWASEAAEINRFSIKFRASDFKILGVNLGVQWRRRSGVHWWPCACPKWCTLVALCSPQMVYTGVVFMGAPGVHWGFPV